MGKIQRSMNGPIRTEADGQFNQPIGTSCVYLRSESADSSRQMGRTPPLTHHWRTSACPCALQEFHHLQQQEIHVMDQVYQGFHRITSICLRNSPICLCEGELCWSRNTGMFIPLLSSTLNTVLVLLTGKQPGIPPESGQSCHSNG